MPIEVPPDLAGLQLPDGRPCSPDQIVAVHKIMVAVRDRDLDQIAAFTLSGDAGSGKTSIARVIVSAVRSLGLSVEYVAPTGTAALRLRQLTGEPVSTIHQRFYGAPKELYVCPLCREPSEVFMRTISATECYACPECKGQVPATTQFEVRLVFPKPMRMGEADQGMARFVAVDEASMVPTRMGDDMREGLSPGDVILFIGDPNQLPPIEEDKKEDEAPASWAANFEHPTAHLTQVHRQAGGSPILETAGRIARDIKQGTLAWPSGAYTRRPGVLTVARDASYSSAAQWLAERRRSETPATLITWMHKDRVALNEAVRTLRGLVAESERLGVPVVKGDRLLCKCNLNGYLNGEILRVVEHARWTGRDAESRYDRVPVLEVVVSAPMAFGPGAAPRKVWILPELMALKAQSGYRAILKAAQKRSAKLFEEWTAEVDEVAAGARPNLTARFRDFEHYLVHELGFNPNYLLHVWWGEAITGHAAQGSEWDAVGVVIARGFLGRWKADVGWSRRWLYTAITRAQGQLAIFDLAKNP